MNLVAEKNNIALNSSTELLAQLTPPQRSGHNATVGSYLNTLWKNKIGTDCVINVSLLSTLRYIFKTFVFRCEIVLSRNKTFYYIAIPQRMF